MNTFMDRVNVIVQKNQAPINQMAAAPNVSYPDTGMGALENVSTGAPRQTMIANQPHMLAYINPQEEQMLRNAGGAGMPGPDGIPAYWWHDDEGPSFTESLSSFGNTVKDTFKEVTSLGKAETETYNPTTDTPTVTTPTVTTPTVTTNTNTGTGALPVADTTTGTGALPVADTTTGSNTLRQDLTNLVTFAGNKSYVNGVETTVNNLGQTMANWVDGKDNLEYQDNVLYDLTTGLPVVGTEAEDAFFNTGYDGTTGTYENDVTGTGEIITTELPPVGTSVVPVIFKDRFGKEHATQAAADAADAVVTSDDVAANITSVNATPEKKVAENSWRETFANLLTKGDSAFYKGGTLYGYDKDGKVIDLTGGGETFNRVTGLSNYVYGVSDNEATGTAIDTTGMSQTEKNAALTKQQMIYDIAPNDLAYFASFLPNLATNMIPGVLGEISGVASFFGGSLGDLMLKGGIEERRAIVAAETAALEAGAEPRYNENGEYIGHDNNVLNELAGGLAGQDAINATVGYVVNEAIDNAVASNPGSSYDGNVDLDGDGIGTIYTDTNGNNMFDEGEPTFATDDIYEDYPMIDSKGSYVEAMEEQASNDNNTTVTTSSGDGSDGGSDRAAVAASIFKRYYRGGSGAGLPAWLQKYASGATINQLLEKVTVEGEVYYKTTDKPPRYIKEIELAGAVDLGVEEPSANNEE